MDTHKVSRTRHRVTVRVRDANVDVDARSSVRPCVRRIGSDRIVRDARGGDHRTTTMSGRRDERDDEFVVFSRPASRRGGRVETAWNDDDESDGGGVPHARGFAR